MLKAYKYRIYPNKAQQQLLNKHFGCVRYIYNWGLETRIRQYQENNKSLSSIDLCLRLTKLKQELEWLNDANAQALQGALRNLDNAYTRFFREKKGFPKFKKKSGRQSFQCPQAVEVDFESEIINIPKIKNIKAAFDRQFTGKIKTTTISRTTTCKYYASVLVETTDEPPKKQKPNRKKAVGVDLGIKDFATLSTGEKIANPKHLEKQTARLKLFARRMSRRTKGSIRREKARQRFALQHERIANQRNDFLHKLSTRIIRENQSVCLEDLNVSGMMKNHKLARSISSVGWARFVEMLKYKADWYGKHVIQIGRFEPSSKMCSCGKINTELNLKDRTWTCAECGATHNRDVLAANNIKDFAFDRQSLIQYRVGLTRINAQGEERLQPKGSAPHRTEKSHRAIGHKEIIRPRKRNRKT